MDWIDIRVQEPVHNQRILVCANGVVTAATYESLPLGYMFSSCGWNGYEWNFDFNDEDVTDWMPLPAPPNRKTGDENEHIIGCGTAAITQGGGNEV